MLIFRLNAFLLNFVVWAASGRSLNHSLDSDPVHEEAISYSFITKQEKRHDLPAGHQDYHGYPYIEAYKEKLHANKNQEERRVKCNEDHHGPDIYQFHYGVRDPSTGDLKDHWETRDGASIKGGYSLKETDATMFIKSYFADPNSKFQSVNSRIMADREQNLRNKQQKAIAKSFIIFAGH